MELAAIAPTHVAVINGNHDDVSREYEPTDLSDGWATFAARNVERYLAAARTDMDIRWSFPDVDRMAVEIEAAPDFFMVLLHGHQVAANPEKVMDWVA